MINKHLNIAVNSLVERLTRLLDRGELSRIKLRSMASGGTTVITMNECVRILFIMKM